MIPFPGITINHQVSRNTHDDVILKEVRSKAPEKLFEHLSTGTAQKKRLGSS